MLTATATRKTTRKPAKVTRTASLGAACNGTRALKLTITTGKKIEHFGYYLTETGADYGRGFHLEKFGVEQEEGEDRDYDVHLDPAGFDSCSCKGFTRWHHCKHRDVIKMLVTSKRI
jgi:hypothetical protein